MLVILAGAFDGQGDYGTGERNQLGQKQVSCIYWTEELSLDLPYATGQSHLCSQP